MGPMGGQRPALARSMQQSVRDATAPGPLIPDELLMMDANPCVRVGPQAVIQRRNTICVVLPRRLGRHSPERLF